MILQIDFTNLASPEIMTQSLATLIMIMLTVISWAGIRLRSAAVFILWAITVVVLVLTFITSLPFIWFWLLIMIDVIMVAVSASVKYLLQ